VKNELGRVLGLVDAFKTSGTTRARFARQRRLHPSAFSRLLRVAELPPAVLDELGQLPRLSRTHLEVLATAPPERRGELLEAVRSGRSTYRLRDRRETTSVPVGAPAAHASPGTSPDCGAGTAVAVLDDRGPLAQVARELAASPDETLAFASELLLVLWRSGRERVEASFRAFRAKQ
jgi:hypothetical protein